MMFVWRAIHCSPLLGFVINPCLPAPCPVTAPAEGTAHSCCSYCTPPPSVAEGPIRLSQVDLLSQEKTEDCHHSTSSCHLAITQCWDTRAAGKCFSARLEGQSCLCLMNTAKGEAHRLEQGLLSAVPMCWFQGAEAGVESTASSETNPSHGRGSRIRKTKSQHKTYPQTLEEMKGRMQL